MTTENSRNPASDRIFDLIRGYLPPVEAASFSAEVEASPALRAERDRLTAFLAAASAAHEVELDPAAATRVAARAREHVRREEDRRPTPTPVRPAPRLVWARFLAISVGVHVVALGVLALRAVPSAPARSAPAAPEIELPPGDGTAAVPPGEVDDSAAFARPPSLAPYATGDALAAVPIRDIVPDLPPAAAEGSPVPEPAARASSRFFPGVELAMSLRGNQRAKSTLLHRFGGDDAETVVGTALAALAKNQGQDGGFDASGLRSRPGATALVLLAFLSEGRSSRDDGSRDVVRRGIAYLRGASVAAGARVAGVEDRSLVCLALAEDLMLSHGSLTPAEDRLRSSEIAALAKELGGGKADGVAGGWRALALASAARVGVRSPARAGDVVQALASADMGGDAGTARTGSPLLVGTGLLLGRDAPGFRGWADRTLPAISKRFADDGLVREGADLAARVEQTALALLTLQVSYRTY